jgi:predicted metalloendopeptidase
VAQPEILKKFDDMLASVPIDDWKLWLRWRVLKVSAPYLSKPIVDEEFHFSRGVLAGVQEQLPRSQTCVQVVDRDMGDALGEAYVARYFPPEAKQRMSIMVANLRAEMREKLQNADWLEPQTRQSAVKKLDAFTVKIGYADRWRDYSTLTIDRTTYFENVRAAWQHAEQYRLAKIGKPVDRVDWNMTPPTVNAYSNAGGVEVVFPAGILQPPFFDLTADDAENYGAIGAVIGHEMGHQFDDSGSKFDSTGMLNNWWTAADRAKFDTRAGCVVDQFNSIDVGNGLHHNGRLVLGEALGDLGGVAVAFKAYQRSLAGKPALTVDGFTGEQRFFIAFARIWGVNSRPEATRLQLATNPHPLAQYRAIATLQNIPEFHRAFNCTDGDAMVRPSAQQCKLW